jgi:hypothetical protein
MSQVIDVLAAASLFASLVFTVLLLTHEVFLMLDKQD